MKQLADCRLYTFVDSAYLNGREPVEIARQLCEGGADLIQLRAKDWPKKKICATAKSLLPITHAADVALIINDHWDIASETGADFCHLGQEDFFEANNPPQPSASMPQLGLSTHVPEQAERATVAGAAYLGVGPVFATPTKPGRPAVTLDYVSWAARHIDQPWFAIGGITLDNVDDVLSAGASRICVVSAILTAPNIAHACQQFHERLASAPLRTTP
jgi:thiamine-phosphate pyrophosphorylase